MWPPPSHSPARRGRISVSRLLLLHLHLLLLLHHLLVLLLLLLLCLLLLLSLDPYSTLRWRRAGRQQCWSVGGAAWVWWCLLWIFEVSMWWRCNSCLRCPCSMMMNRPISIYRLGEMPIQSCGQCVSSPRGKQYTVIGLLHKVLRTSGDSSPCARALAGTAACPPDELTVTMAIAALNYFVVPGLSRSTINCDNLPLQPAAAARPLQYPSSPRQLQSEAEFIRHTQQPWLRVTLFELDLI